MGGVVMTEREPLSPEATPRPWTAQHGQVVKIEGDAGNTFVCEIDASYESDGAAAQAHADADLIVQAVNGYETALGLLREATLVSSDQWDALDARMRKFLEVELGY